MFDTTVSDKVFQSTPAGVYRVSIAEGEDLGVWGRGKPHPHPTFSQALDRDCDTPFRLFP